MVNFVICCSSYQSHRQSAIMIPGREALPRKMVYQ